MGRLVSRLCPEPVTGGCDAVWMSTQTATPEETGALVARLAAISRKTVSREIGRGELPAIHVGRQLRIDPTDLSRYLGRMP